MGRPKTTAFLTLDVRALLRVGAGTVRFPGGQALPFVRDVDALRIGWGQTAYRFELVATRQPFGGARRWVRCGGCARRCAVVFLARSGWRCRSCVGAVYPVTREGFSDRALRRARRVRERLGMGPNLCVPLEKPPGMHWHTFVRLAEREYAAAGVVFGWTGRILDRLEKKGRRR